jgi:organic radical activating enzyme
MKSVSFIVTDRCNIECKFCAPNCGITLSNKLTGDNMKKVLNDILEFDNIGLVVFTGGEPMLFYSDVFEVASYIRKYSPKTITRIVTNGFWGSDSKLLEEISSKIAINKINEINISVDDFHQEHIQIATIRNVVERLRSEDVTIVLAHKTYPNSKSNYEYYKKTLGNDLINIVNGISYDNKFLFISGYTIPVGRGSDEINGNEWIPYKYDKSAKERNWNIPCNDVFQNFNISANGFLSPCCGLVSRDLRLFYCENVIRQNTVLVMEKYCKSVLYNWLALEGPYSIAFFLKENYRLNVNTT